MKSNDPVINIQQLLENERLLRMIEIELDNGNKYIIQFENGSLLELKDSESLKRLLEKRNID